MSMWEPFTERARRSIVLAQEEAQRLGNNYIGTEHILLGIISEGESLAAKVLESLGVNLAKVRQEVEAIVGRGGQTVQQEMVFTPRAKRVIELAFEEARQLNHNYIGTEHLLLGLIREGEGVAARVLTNLGVDPAKCACRRHRCSAPRGSLQPRKARARRRRWTRTGATSPSLPAIISSIRSSDGTTRSSASFKFSRAALRTIRRSSASPASAKRRSPRALHSA